MNTLTRHMDEIAERIASEGMGRVPEAIAVAALMADLSPVAAGIVMAESEPAVARERAFAKIAALVRRIGPGSSRSDEVESALTWATPGTPIPPGFAQRAA